MTHPPLARALRDAWHHDFVGLPAWPVPGDGVPRTGAEVLDVLREAPEQSLEFVQSNREPGTRMAEKALPRDRAECLDPAAGHFTVLRAGNVAVWCEPVAAWCRRWADFVAEAVGERAETVRDVRAEIYVTMPHGVTAFHADPSHNFTHQVQGRREIRAFSNRDPRLIDDATRAGVYLHRAMYPVYREECEDRAARWRLEPGNACYLPPLTGHWLQNEEEVSISYVISVRTAAEQREKMVHGMNQRLRSLGLRPARFGDHPGRDRLKATVELRLRRARRWVAQHVQGRPADPHLDPLEL